MFLAQVPPRAEPSAIPKDRIEPCVESRNWCSSVLFCFRSGGPSKEEVVFPRRAGLQDSAISPQMSRICLILVTSQKLRSGFGVRLILHDGCRHATCGLESRRALSSRETRQERLLESALKFRRTLALWNLPGWLPICSLGAAILLPHPELRGIHGAPLCS